MTSGERELKVNKLSVRRFVLGWSFEKMAMAAALVCSVLAIWVQLAVSRRALSALQNTIENEIALRLSSKIDQLYPKIISALHSKKSSQIKEVLTDIQASDSRIVIAGMYDVFGNLITPDFYKDQDWKNDIEQGIVWKKLPQKFGDSVYETHNRKTSEFHVSDIIFRLDGRQSSKSPLVGSVRVLANLESLDSKMSRAQWLVSIPAFCFVCLSALVLWYICQKTLLQPLDRMTSFLKIAAKNLDNLPKFRVRSTDAQSIQEVVKALFEGIGEVALRNKTLRFLENTRAALQKSNEDSFLNIAQELCVSHKVTSGCRLFLARENREQRKFFLEKTTDKVNENGNTQTLNVGQRDTSTLLNRNGIDEMRYDAVLQFLKTGAPQEWSHDILFIRTTITADADLQLVAMVTPNSGFGLDTVNFESFMESWLLELARLYHQVRFLDLASNLELSREMQRKWVQSDHPVDDGMSKLNAVLGYESVPCRFINGNFLCVFRFEKKQCSLVLLGDVGGHELRAGLAATGIVAALQDRFHFVKDEAPHVILEELMQSVNRYMWGTYGGTLAASAQALYFNHTNGQGLLSCFGQPFPFVVSPQERKPMVVVPLSTHGLLGLGEQLEFSVTPFSILPGQTVFACTEGLLEVQDIHGKKFEKTIQRGALSEITQQVMLSGAQSLLMKYLEAVKYHAGNNSVNDDLTGIVLLTSNTFNTEEPTAL